MPNEICRVIVQQKSEDGLFRWFFTDKQIVNNTIKVDLDTLFKMEITDSKTRTAELEKIGKSIFEIDGISKASVSRYLLTVNLASEMFDWEEDDIELKVLDVIRDTVGVPVRVIKRKDSKGNVANTSPDSGMDGLEPIEVSDTSLMGRPKPKKGNPIITETKDGEDVLPDPRYDRGY